MRKTANKHVQAPQQASTEAYWCSLPPSSSSPSKQSDHYYSGELKAFIEYKLHTIWVAPRCNIDKTDSGSGLADSAGGNFTPYMAPYITWKHFGELGKTVTAMRTNLDTLNAGQKRISIDDGQ
ncbi:hypothetical protein L873DRAFT_1795138 [Choiromyces venosus 120613-1]|uniref:Uncharacterized protein n=1 Tax=Choiromyces venosus 120613-1 TaxID=1336337 RepID=A0A3N4IXS8_9PEZI|nr:hypothetical protein L873DRAFT_1795138 [Choiromyces venosus 120613-1]